MEQQIDIQNWIVSYDQNGLPGKITGELATEFDSFKIGHPVVINQPAILDLQRLFVVDQGGRQFHLKGAGLQSILTNQIEPFDFIKIFDDDDFSQNEE